MFATWVPNPSVDLFVFKKYKGWKLFSDRKKYIQNSIETKKCGSHDTRWRKFHRPAMVCLGFK